MLQHLATAWLRRWGADRCFRVYGRDRRETDWHVIDIVATHRRDFDSPWPAPFFRGTCVTWTAQVIAVGWDFAAMVYREQSVEPSTRDHPMSVSGGRLSDRQRRIQAGCRFGPSACEVLAHECGHTAQARRWGGAYWLIGGVFTLFREGGHWWNHFENTASENGLFGGIVNGSVSPKLIEWMQSRDGTS